MSYSRSAAGETDVTCIGKVTVGLPTKNPQGEWVQEFPGGITDDNKTWAYWDPDDEYQRVIVKSVDFGVVDPGKLNCEFFDVGQLDESWVGLKKRLTVVQNKTGAKGAKQSGNGAFYRTATSPYERKTAEQYSRYAYLTELGNSFAVGEFVKCNCTFTFTE